MQAAVLKDIPFDSMCLAAAVRELQPLVGGRLQRAVQPNALTLVIGIYAAQSERQVLLSCSAKFARMHATGQRLPSSGDVPELAAAIRKHLDGARLRGIEQSGFDRIATLAFDRGKETYRLVAELTGKHANLILVGPDGRVVAAAHNVPHRQSKRAIFKGTVYEPPPFPLRKPVYEAESWDEFGDSEGLSPFLRRLLLARAGLGDSTSVPENWDRLAGILAEVKRAVQGGRFSPVSAGSAGAYPISIAALATDELPVKSYSEAADRAFAAQEAHHELEASRTRMLAPLNRVRLAREVALQDLDQAAAAAHGARRRQEEAELILAYAHQIAPGQGVLETQDYGGRPIAIPIDPELSPQENAARIFEKAKKAKARAGFVEDQRKRLRDDHTALIGAIRRVQDAKSLEQVLGEEDLARRRKWLRSQSAPAMEKSERPYEGHRIRELIGPGGVRILYGENATSNDYLTQRVAKPNDYWLHVRGGTSAHVVVSTQNRPEKVGKEVLEFAARVAVANSPSKHAGYVTVDCTLKKHVRKPRGAPPGTVAYSHEKSIHVHR